MVQTTEGHTVDLRKDSCYCHVLHLLKFKGQVSDEGTRDGKFKAML